MYNISINGKFRQLLTAIVVNLVSISFGISCGWPSPTIPKLRSSQPPIGNVSMSEEEISWIGGLLPIGGLLMTPFCGILVERFGRKNFAFLTGLPHIVSWLLIIFGHNYIYLYAARLAIGMGGAMTFFIVPMYVSEISSEDIRGILGSLLCLLANSGVLFAFVVGAFLPYRLFATLSLIFPVVFVFIIFFMPETPVHLVRCNRLIEAHKSLMFLRDNNESLVKQELARLQQQINDSNNITKSVSFLNLFNSRATRKGLVISIGLLAGQQFSGIFAMISYAEMIFQRAGSSISAEIAPIIIGVIQIIGAYISTMLMDCAGRRLLTLISCFGMAISHAFVGLFFYLQQNNYDVSTISCLPLVALSTYVIGYVIGMGSVPFIVISEIFCLNVNSSATTLCLILFWAMSFTSIKIFALSMDYLGADGCFFTLASCCVISFIFTYCTLPETKGRKREDIVDELAGIAVKSCHENNDSSEKHNDNNAKDQNC